MADTKAELEWELTPVIARVALIRSVIDYPTQSEAGKYGSALWGTVPDWLRDKLRPILIPDTDSQDRTVKAGWAGGKPVYRASMAGRCIKELYLWRVGAGGEFDSSKGADPYRDKGELGAQEGTLHEGWMIENLKTEGFEIASTAEDGGQEELEIHYKRFVVRSHPDGLIRGLEIGSSWRVLECKALNEDRFAMWKSMGWSAFPNYAHQMSLEMFLASKKYQTEVLGFFYVKNRNTGETLRTLVNKPPIDPATIINKFSSIEDMVEKESMPHCAEDAEWWWCPFLGGGHCDAVKRPSGDPVPEVDDPQFVELLTRFKAVKLAKKEAEAEEGALRSLVMERMVVPAVRVGPFFAKVSKRTRNGFDIPGAKEWIDNNNGDASQFNKETSYDELRVTGGKVTDDDSDAFTTG